jgi:hypothetical protein
LDNWSPAPETHIDAIADLGFSLFSAIASSTLRSRGHDELGDLLVSMFRSHHGNYFVEGVRKLGLDAEESDAIRAAKYHYFSNVIGGIDMGYAEESPRKAWVFYKTPFCYFDSPYWPSVSAAFMRPEGYAEVFRAWHGNNGASLGNPRLAFVFTHMLFRGDAYDAGYFVEADEPLPPGQSYQQHWGEEPPLMRTLPFDDAWTRERRVKAAFKYHAGYIADSMKHLVAAVGVIEADAIIEHAYRVFLFQTRERLAGYLDVDLGEINAAAKLLQRFQALYREEADLVTEADSVVVRQQGSYLGRFLDAPLAPEIEGAVTSAWDALARFLEPGTRIRQTASLARGDGRAEWRFTRGGQ